ncbi:MFS transporter [Catalinimonas niigatensis]|uniref:MFS transporter n=1 Tax=Catalinimonas niigatensis TaxID=1397264 RepID=UPI0026662F2E|nr:MFS transporter [Catalinimonas niigatensis]WPP47989.1 MFS transporter [Catalinimonas niigatensis]
MFKIFATLNRKALLNATIAMILVIVLVYVGSRDLQNFDAALIAYLFGTIFAVFGIAYRYSVWLQRPPTRLYWRRTWQFVFSKRFIPYTGFVISQFVKNILFQRFIYPRGRTRWVGHFLLATGCMLAFLVTIPLTFGWIHFTLKPYTLDIYEAHVFGFAVSEFTLGGFVAFNAFHILNWCSLFVIIGAIMMMRRRLTNGGLIATQSFQDDWLPLILLLAISVTGLGLTFDYSFMQGKTFEFMSVTHAITVILFLVWIPFGKFFHIFQRPAQLGTNVYRREGAKQGMAVCPHTGEEFASQLHINDLKKVTKALDFNFDLEAGGSHLDYSPEGKRAALAKAHLAARQQQGNFFG